MKTIQWTVGLVLAALLVVAMIGAVPRNQTEKALYPVGIAVAVIVILSIILSMP